MSSSICWKKCRNKVVYFSYKYKQRKGYDQKNECSEREFILQSGTFILLSSQDLHYLFSHMKFVSEKKYIGNWISQMTDGIIIITCISFTVVISNFSSFFSFFLCETKEKCILCVGMCNCCQSGQYQQLQIPLRMPDY